MQSDENWRRRATRIRDAERRESEMQSVENRRWRATAKNWRWRTKTKNFDLGNSEKGVISHEYALKLICEII
ncbi:unnamed protein product [Arabidopsis lyrata]|uniref:Expressed protein n=1 Tax=Arabidopsis lyrata subsp. lyrata TaxID=81972 RepID=D7L1T0_ARALL|nr:expressed protein [Arabidopsis lyrata subsp. lyrata]CAH8262197.1 unnamed protein product [Arabidopsis lyrata]